MVAMSNGPQSSLPPAGNGQTAECLARRPQFRVQGRLLPEDSERSADCGQRRGNCDGFGIKGGGGAGAAGKSACRFKASAPMAAVTPAARAGIAIGVAQGVKSTRGGGPSPPARSRRTQRRGLRFRFGFGFGLAFRFRLRVCIGFGFGFERGLRFRLGSSSASPNVEWVGGPSD